MADFDYDLFVIGAGSGGVRGSRIAASLGARVAICEERFYGGTCVNVGCVPKKLMVYGSSFAQEVRDAVAYGWDVEVGTPDWPRMVANIQRDVARLNGIYERILERNGVDRIWGRGTLVDPHTVQVGDATYRARHILIATGGTPRALAVPGAEHTIDSDAVFVLPACPPRVAVLGGGYIGAEFASIFLGYGAEVHLVHRGEHLLRGFDSEIVEHLESELTRRGVALHLQATPVSITKTADALTLALSDGTTLEVDCVVRAIGRDPNTKGLGLESAGVETLSSGAIRVDERFRTSTAHIYAVGDVIGGPHRLTPIALGEGMSVARDLFGGGSRFDPGAVPTAVFTQPSVGTVGLTEEQAREQLEEVTIFASSFRPMKNTVSGNPGRSFMKLVVCGTTGRVVGAHMVGPEAGEIIQGIAVAIQAGATKAQFDATIGIHPTAAEEFVTMRTPRTS